MFLVLNLRRVNTVICFDKVRKILREKAKHSDFCSIQNAFMVRMMNIYIVIHLPFEELYFLGFAK